MRSRLVLTTVVAVALACLAAPILAQQPGGQKGGQPGGRGGFGGGGFGGGGFGGFGGFGGRTSRLALLNVAEVQKELELVDEQMTAIAKVREELQPMGRGGFGGGQPGQPGGRRRGGNNPPPPNNPNGASFNTPVDWFFVQQEAQQPQPGQRGQRGQRGTPPTPEEQAAADKARADRLKAEKEKLGEILLPHQMKRLNEIYFQQLGARVVDDPDGIAELKITDAQKEQVAKIREENQAAMRELFQGAGGGGGFTEEMRTKMAEATKKNDEKILAVLTAEQKAKLEELKGKPFAMPENALGGRGGPGGRGAPGGAPGGTRGTRGKTGGNPNPNN